MCNFTIFIYRDVVVLSDNCGDVLLSDKLESCINVCRYLGVCLNALALSNSCKYLTRVQLMLNTNASWHLISALCENRSINANSSSWLYINKMITRIALLIDKQVGGKLQDHSDQLANMQCTDLLPNTYVRQKLK